MKTFEPHVDGLEQLAHEMLDGARQFPRSRVAPMLDGQVASEFRTCVPLTTRRSAGAFFTGTKLASCLQAGTWPRRSNSGPADLWASTTNQSSSAQQSSGYCCWQRLGPRKPTAFVLKTWLNSSLWSANMTFSKARTDYQAPHIYSSTHPTMML